VTPWRIARPLRGRTCASTPVGIDRAIPVGIVALPIGGMTISPSTSAFKSIPADPSV
jgi:hypothetical protein